MTKNTLIFLRHAETKKDKDTPVSKWVLTEEGKKRAEDLARTGIFDDVDIIISSGEEKAYQTAQPFAERLGKDIIRVPELGELDRDKGWLMSKEEYDDMKSKIFENFDFTAHGWETARHALDRFSDAAEKIDTHYKTKKILIVTHGTVMSLYFAKLQNRLSSIFTIWENLGFCDWGIVKGDEVIKEIS